jgi:hypothetical protein
MWFDDLFFYLKIPVENFKMGHGKKNVAFKKDSKKKQSHEIKHHGNVSEPYLFVDFGIINDVIFILQKLYETLSFLLVNHYHFFRF